MAEPLKNSYGPAIVQAIAGRIAAVEPAFDHRGFIDDALDGYDALELMARAGQIADAMRVWLPIDPAEAITILTASMGPKLEATEGNGLSPFLYLPHGMFIGRHGLECFEVSMHAQHELTQRFTAEFSLRPFLTHHPRETLAVLAGWVDDPSEHVRRAVSEATRPRLPWAPRLTVFAADPSPVLALLDRLKDDPSLYVRRSVANHLNDIGKENPALLIETARRWLQDATPERQWIVRHALRSSIKGASADALALLGYAHRVELSVENVRIEPARVRIGGRVRVAFDLVNRSSEAQRALVDLRVHFVKGNGGTQVKVFKLKTCALGPGERERFAKSVSVAELTTRRHYPGGHEVELMVNGEVQRLGRFDLDA